MQLRLCISRLPPPLLQRERARAGAGVLEVREAAHRGRTLPDALIGPAHGAQLLPEVDEPDRRPTGPGIPAAAARGAGAPSEELRRAVHRGARAERGGRRL